jgi:hypothetical protein
LIQRDEQSGLLTHIAATETPEPFDPQNLASISQNLTSSYGSRASKSLQNKVLERNRHMKTISKFTCPAFASLALAPVTRRFGRATK